MNTYHVTNRPNREILDADEIQQILKNGKFAVISMCRGDEPYIVTLSYGYDSDTNALYFHCSPQGLKIDFIQANPIVCATIIEDGGYIQNECGHKYKTVVFWGKMEILQSIEEKRMGMEILLNHLETDSGIVKEKAIMSEGYFSKMVVLKLSILQIHGKQGR